MKSNGVYIICFGAKKELRVGRAHETEVRINDISVSRHHASFKMIDSEVFL
jgi:pSer/pThr/pTyr-binding forkhead associated (FHA) protein